MNGQPSLRERMLLTNEHVAREVHKHSLARKFFDAPDYLHINNPYITVGAPEDLAITRTIRAVLQPRRGSVILSSESTGRTFICQAGSNRPGRFERQ
jgi:hypothetical protein